MSQVTLSSKTTYNRGITLVEVIVGSTIVSIVVAMVLFSLNTLFQNKERLLDQNKALYLAESGIETVRFLRDEDWTNISALSVDTTYYLAVSTTTVAISGTPEVVDGFNREFVLRSVYRDAISDDLMSSTDPGTYIDTDSYWLEFYVGNSNGTSTLSALVTNLFKS